MSSVRSRFSARALATAAGGVVMASVAVGQTTSTWVNTAGGNWSDAGNWSNGVPNNVGGSTFNAVLPTLLSGLYTVTLNIPVTVIDLTLATPDPTLALTTNRMTVRRNYTQTQSTLLGSLTGGQVSVAGITRLEGATLDDVQRFTTTGQLIFQGAGDNDICDTDMDHRGNMCVWSGTGDIRMDGNARFTNGFASSFTISNDQSVTGPNGAFVNNGRLIKSTGGDTTDFASNITFSNVGTVEVHSGTLQINTLSPATFNAGTLNTGTWRVLNGRTLDLVGNAITTNAADVTLSGAGAMLAAIDGLSVNAAPGRFTVQNRPFTTVGSFTNDGALNVLGAGTDFTIPLGSQLTNFTAGTLSPGTYNIQGRVLAPLGTDIATLGARVTLDGPASAFADTAGSIDRTTTITAIQGTGELAIDNARNYNSTAAAVTVQPGGRLGVGAGSTMQLQGLTNFDGTALTSGIYTIRNGTLNIGAAAGDINTVAASLTVDGPSAAFIAAGDLLDSITTVASGGALTVRGGKVLSSAPTLTVNNGGTLNVLGTGTRLNIAGGFNNNGSTNISGTLQFNNAAFVSVPSGLRVLPGGRVVNQNNIDAFTALAQIQANAQFSIDSGESRTLLGNLTTNATGTLTVGGGGPTATLNIPGNYLQNGATQLNAGALNVTGTYNLNGPTTGRGSVTAGSIVMGPGGSLSPGFSPGQIDITGNVSVSAEAAVAMEIGAPDSIENRGTLNDFLAITGGVTHGEQLGNFLAGTLNYSFINAFDPEIGDQFILAHATGAVTGQFAQTVPFNTGILAEARWIGQDLVLTVTALPTPSAAALFGLAGLLAARRRR